MPKARREEIMEKLKMHSPDLTQDNIARIRELFPSCVTEAKGADGSIKLTIDFDQLKQELSGQIVEGPQERYHLNWPGKREALITANAPIAKTLRPVRDESVDFDTTKNLFIEGDNLDALKLLQETYLGKIKMIYIDPPYNTGNDFVYDDDFAEDSDEFLVRSNQKDENGNRLVANTESNGRFHSDWLTMMYSRLRLGRNLLREDGCIFISIDDSEVHNLKKICDEIFGEDNFIADLIWEKRFTRNNDARLMSFVTDHILFYRKSAELQTLREPRTEKSDSIYSNPDNDPRGKWTSVSYISQRTKEERKNLSYPIKNPLTGVDVVHPINAWKYSHEQYLLHAKENRLHWGKEGENQYPRLKRFLSELKEGIVPVNLWSYKETGTSDDGTKEVNELIGKDIFNYPKPTSLLKRMLQLSTTKESDIVLDFFSGSGTTADAVMQLNSSDGGNRKYILVQLPEACDIKSQAYKSGYKSINEIGKERIRRAAKKIKENNPLFTGDLGFRVLKVDTSNMTDIYYIPDNIDQKKLLDAVRNIKPDRDNPEDLLFQVLLDWGVDLTLPIVRKKIQGKAIYFVDDNALVACFDKGITEELVKELAENKPLRVVFRDNGFESDAVKINADQIFKQLSPGTEVKSI